MADLTITVVVNETDQLKKFDLPLEYNAYADKNSWKIFLDHLKQL